jgi:hypothetical protein
MAAIRARRSSLPRRVVSMYHPRMDEIRFIRDQYVSVRDSLVSWLPKHLAGRAWYFQPRPQSTSAAWIVPHLVAFEQVTIFGTLKGWQFPPVADADFVERYRGGAAGHTMGDSDLCTPEQALASLTGARGATVGLLDALIGGQPSAAAVGRNDVFRRDLANFSHDTEHVGQLKYLAGTYERLGAKE